MFPYFFVSTFCVYKYPEVVIKQACMVLQYLLLLIDILTIYSTFISTFIHSFVQLFTILNLLVIMVNYFTQIFPYESFP